MQLNLNNFASLCDCHGTYFTDLDRHSLVCAYVLAVKHATLTAINLKIALNNATSRRLATRRNELEQLGKLITLPVWSKTIRPKQENNDMKNPKLYKQVVDDMRNILKSGAMPLSQKLNELEWRDNFLREFCF